MGDSAQKSGVSLSGLKKKERRRNGLEEELFRHCFRKFSVQDSRKAEKKKTITTHPIWQILISNVLIPKPNPTGTFMVVVVFCTFQLMSPDSKEFQT